MKNILTIVFVMAAGIATFVVLVKTKPQPKSAQEKVNRPLIESREVQAAVSQIVYPAQGTVMPSEEIELTAEVAGKVIWTSPNLVPGGRFKKGETMFRIDSRDYRAAVKQQEAALKKEKVNLQTEKGKARVTAREWEIMTRNVSNIDESGKDLALRKPQLISAQAQVEAAESALEKSQAQLSRTSVRAPFDGIVKEEAVDPGRYVAPGVKLGLFSGTNKAWVQVSVPFEWLPGLQLPKDGESGGAVEVQKLAGNRTITRTGRVVRLLGDVDAEGKMARLLVEIDDPMGTESEDTLPLLMGTFVDLKITGMTTQQLIEVARSAVHQGNRVYIHTTDGKLAIREITIAVSRKDSVLVSGGLEPGERVITSRVPNAMDGMLVRTADENDDSPEPEPKADTAKGPKVAAGEEPTEDDKKEAMQ